MAALSLSHDLLRESCDNVVLFGDAGVGKTSIFNRFAADRFEPQIKESVLKKKWMINAGKAVFSHITAFSTSSVKERTMQLNDVL